MDYEHILINETHDGAVAEVTLQPPPANIVSSAMMDEISHFLAAQQELTARKLIVFTGAGKHFSFGAAVEEHTPEQVGGMLPKFHRFIGALLASRVPTLAKVTGCCLGGGFELALACTFILADHKAKFAVPEIKLGVFPPPASVLLPWRAGDAFASEMILGGEILPVSRLKDRGVVNGVSDEGALDADLAVFIAQNILPKSAAALRYACTASRMSTVAQYEQFISRLEALYLDGVMATKDAVEGITAFLEKRDIKWTNE
ncbi:MAG: enoyl-CoA hydratase/isomerase family protein [Bacteroidota bacterium]|jgi:cyclohexa-1,5-dienecarbonyl-CoA hydratase